MATGSKHKLNYALVSRPKDSIVPFTKYQAKEVMPAIIWLCVDLRIAFLLFVLHTIYLCLYKYASN